MAAIQSYLADNSEPRLPRRIATYHASLSPAAAVANNRHPSTAKIARGTSMVVFGITSTASGCQGSLAALTSSSSVQDPPSISTSIGRRVTNNQRLLEYDAQGALQVPPLRHAPWYECPFAFLNCRKRFTDFHDWIRHSITHFGVHGPPNRNSCCFCDAKFADCDSVKCWGARMAHVATHHQLGHRLAHARPDFELFGYLWTKKLMRPEEYRNLMGDSTRVEPSRTEGHRDDEPTRGALTFTHNTQAERRRLLRT